MDDTTSHDAPDRDDLHTMTLRQLEAKVADAGVLISRRQLMRHCDAGTFDAKKLPATNNVKEWFIAPASIDKGIADIKTLQEQRARRDAARRATPGHVVPMTPLQNSPDTTGHDTPGPALSDHQNKDDGEGETERVTSRHSPPDLDIFEHPYVKRLEKENEKLHDKYEAQVRRTEEIQIKHQDRLIELQRMTTIGQSKTLADFMLQAKNLFVGGEPEVARPPREGEQSTL